MEDCVFCKILKGEVPAFVICQDDSNMAILDIFPNMDGQTVVIPKNHRYEYAFSMPDKELSDLIIFSKRVASYLDKAMGCFKTALVIEGMMAQHVHVKLYPLLGTEKGMSFNSDTIEKFSKYEGYITTKLGPRASESKLEETLKLIKQANGLK